MNEPEGRKQLARYVEELYNGLERARAEIPRGTFDPQAVVTRVGTDPQQLTAWVRANTTWAPYRGSLRGPVGVLMDRMGNSLDRSLLLAELLRLSGHSVRLVRVRLSETAASGLLKQVHPMASRREPGTPPPQSTPTGVRAEFQPFAAVLRQLTDAARTNGRRRYEDARQRATTQSAALLAAVGDSGSGPADDADMSAMSDHWLVQRRQGDAWTDLDPQPGASGPGETASPAEVITPGPDGRIPLDARLCHELVIRVVAEQWAAGRLTERVALERTVRPSELIGQEITLRHLPAEWLSDSPTAKGAGAARVLSRTEALAQTQWTPVLSIGERRFAPAMVNANGSISPRKATGKFRDSASGAVGGMLGGLGADEEEPSILTAEWIEYSIRNPGGEPVTCRHEVFDLLGPAARATASSAAPNPSETGKLTRVLALLEVIEIVPVVCSWSTEFLASLVAGKVLSEREAWLEALRTDDANRRAALLGAMPDPAGPVGPAFAYQVARSALAPEIREVFTNAIGVVNYRWRGTVDAQGTSTYRGLIDVVANPVGVLPGGTSGSPFAARLRRGVADTAAEYLVAGSPADPSNTTTVFALAAGLGIGSVVIRASANDTRTVAGVTADVRARIQSDLTTGQVVAVPSRPVNGRLGWWRVNPRTGATVGVMDEGFRQGETEKVMTDGLEDTAALSRQMPKKTPRLPGNAGESPRTILHRLGIKDSDPGFHEWLDAICDFQDAALQAFKQGLL